MRRSIDQLFRHWIPACAGMTSEGALIANAASDLNPR
jgi:hypothetical protein